MTRPQFSSGNTLSIFCTSAALPGVCLFLTVLVQTASSQSANLDLTGPGVTSGTMTFQATNSITAGSAFTVGGSASVTFQAGNRIDLLPGFQATAGSGGATFNAFIQAMANPSGNCYTLTYGGVNNNQNDIGAYIAYGTPTPSRINGNEVYMASYTSVSGPNAGLAISNIGATAYLNGAVIASPSGSSNTYGASVTAFTDQTLFVNGQYHLGTFQFGSSANQNVHFGTSPICSALGYPFVPLYYHDYSLTLSTTKPTIVGPNNATSASIWYLGGAPSIDGYYVQTSLYGNANWGSAPALYWSVIQRPDKVSLNGSVANQVMATSTGANKSTAPNGGYDYDVLIQASTDGLPSDAFRISVNAPWSVYGSYVQTVPYGDQGYSSMFRYQVFDVAGNVIPVPITLHETLENCLPDFNGTNWCTLPAEPSTWYGNLGQSGWDPNFPNSWVDYYKAWGAAGLFPSPLNQTDPPGPLGATLVDNRTQKWFVGAAGDDQGGTNVFSGMCVAANKIQSFQDHGERQNVFSPIPAAQCASGVFINP